jgi:hypothetical protein
MTEGDRAEPANANIQAFLYGGVRMDVIAREGDYVAIEVSSRSVSYCVPWLVPTAMLDLCRLAPPSVSAAPRAP